jgi:histone-lysine N-methyltransferase SETD3
MFNNSNENLNEKQINNLGDESPLTNMDMANLEFTSGNLNYFNILKLIHEGTFNSKMKNREILNKNKKELAIYYKDEGNKFFLRREYEIANLYFSKAIENDDTEKVFFSNRAACHLALGNYKSALNDALNCIELDSNYPKGYYRAALAYYEMNRIDDAIKLIEIYKNIGNANSEDITYLLQNIQEKKKIQANLKTKFPSYEKYLSLCNWLLEKGSHFSKLDIHFYSDNHRGVVAKHNIYKDEIILKIPKDQLISIELAKSTEMGAKIANFMYAELNSPKHSLLSSFILNELKNPNTKWKSYLDILPKDYSSFPIFYTDEELTALEGSPFLQQILEKKEDMRRDYFKICNYLPEFAKFDFIKFCEIRMVVSSRIFGVKIEYKKTDVLAPFADLLNHKRPRSTHWYYDEMHKAFFIQSLEDIPIGEEVK